MRSRTICETAVMPTAIASTAGSRAPALRSSISTASRERAGRVRRRRRTRRRGAVAAMRTDEADRSMEMRRPAIAIVVPPVSHTRIARASAIAASEAGLCAPDHVRRNSSTSLSVGTLSSAPSRVQLSAAAAFANRRMFGGPVSTQQRIDERAAEHIAGAGGIDGLHSRRRDAVQLIPVEQHRASHAERDAQHARGARREACATHVRYRPRQSVSSARARRRSESSQRRRALRSDR